jgi:hypothetical protein
MASLNRNSSRFNWQPLDRVAIILIAVLLLVMGALLLKGDRTAPRVRDFSWQGRQVGAQDIAFTLTFSRPMNHSSVENNLRIEPSLPGRFSWAGRRMAYTLNQPPTYGTSYRVSLQGAIDRFSEFDDARTQLREFTGQFESRDRVFVYLGVEGDERGRLVMQNLTRRGRTILTPENLVVMDFIPYPQSDRILFSATERSEVQTTGSKLYTVTTGIHYERPDELLPGESPESAGISDRPAGVVQDVLDNNQFQNLRFNLSRDGRTIVVQRTNRETLNSELWKIEAGDEPTPLPGEPGGDFLITPDGEAIAVLQGEGTAIRLLNPPEAEEPEAAQDSQGRISAEAPLDFLPQFGRVLSFAADGTAAAMVDFNSDFTQSLFVVTNQSEQTELLTTNDGGSVKWADFDATKTILYALITRGFQLESPDTSQAAIVPGVIYVEQPYLVALRLDSGERTDLLRLPIQPDVQMSLAPDNLAILFDQITPSADEASRLNAFSPDERAIANSELWVLPLLVEDGQPIPQEPEPLLISGTRPRWLP